jgi:hypothetical protein
VRDDDETWDPPPLSAADRRARACYRLGIAALVAGASGADELLREAVAIEPTFVLACVGLAVANVVAGDPYEPPGWTTALLRGERQHAEIVETALTGDAARSSDLRREHLLEYPGDLLIAWLPALHHAASRWNDAHHGSTSEKHAVPPGSAEASTG